MMYAVSDLHGCFDLWKKALSELSFSPLLPQKDRIFILGDVLDKGEKPIELLLDIINSNGIYMINGNHELDFLDIISLRNKPVLSNDEYAKYNLYIHNGGDITLKQFDERSKSEQEIILKYLKERKLHMEISNFVLLHGGISNFFPHKSLTQYSAKDLTLHRYKEGEKFFKKKILICGHTPNLNKDKSSAEITISNNGLFYNIDCGCCFKEMGGRLAVLDLNTMTPIYFE